MMIIRFYTGDVEASISLKNESICATKVDGFFLKHGMKKKVVQVGLFAGGSKLTSLPRGYQTLLK